MWHPKNQVNWINIGGNYNKFGLSVLNESGDMVKTTLDKVRFLFLNLFLINLGLGLFLKSFLLLLLILWLVLLDKIEESFLLIRAHGE